MNSRIESMLSKMQTVLKAHLWAFVFSIAHFAYATAQTPIYFEDTVTAILRKNCTACHNAKTAEGGLNLETHADLIRGGDSGPAFDLANVDSSALLTRPVADAENIMPPNDNKVGAERLTESQLAAIKAWLAGGALSRGAAQRPMDYSNLRLPKEAKASYAVSISPDSDFVAFGRGGQLVIHDAKRLAGTRPIANKIESAPVQVIANAHPDFIHSIAISSDGKRIATGSTGHLKIWKRIDPSVDSNRSALASKGIDTTNLLATSLDGTKFAIIDTAPIAAKAEGASEPTATPRVGLKIIGKDGTVLQTLPVPSSSLTLGTWSPSGNRFFAMGTANSLHSWDPSNASANPTTTQLESAVQSMVALDDSTLLVTSQRKVLALKYQSMPNAELVLDHPLAVAMNAAGPVETLSISADGLLVCSVSQDETSGYSALKLWSVTNAKLEGSIERDRKEQMALLNSDRDLRRAQASLERSKASVTEQEKALEAEAAAVKAAQESLEKANQNSVAKEKEMQAAASSVAEHEKAMAETKAAIDAATQKLAQLTTELEPKKKTLGEREKQSAEAKANASNATQALAGIQENQKAAAQRLEDRKKRVEKELESVSAVQAKNATAKVASEAVRFSVQTVAFTGKDQIVATRVVDKNVTNVLDFFSTDTMERIAALALAQPVKFPAELAAMVPPDTPQWQQEIVLDSPLIVQDRATALAFSPDGTTLAVGSGLASRSGQLAIVQLADGKVLKTLPDLHSDTLLGLAYSPDGKWLASCGADKMTKLLNAQNYEVVKLFEGHTHHVLALAWQEDANRLATASSDATVKIWDIEKGESVKTISGFGNEVTSIAFVGSTPNTVSSSMNNLVRLHDSNSGKQNKQFGPTGDALYSVVVSPNGKFAISSGQEGTVRVWNIEDGKLIAEW